jgi:hypothetical protein
MANEWHLIVSPGAVRLAREWVTDPEHPDLRPFGWHQRWASSVANGLPKRRRGDSGQSFRSRTRMRWVFASLPWEMLGPRLVMLSLTYPGEWREWVPDGRVLEDHRRAFLERGRRRWGTPAGVWVKEFQESGRPHHHLYLAVPDAVPGHEYEALRQRTLMRHRLEQRYGRYEGRAKLPAIGRKHGGEFAMWLRDSWSEVVGTQGVVRAHHARGVDVAVAFWTDEVARTKDRVEVAAYLAGESAKWAQKKPPENFPRVGRYYGYVGRNLGFKPDEEDRVVSDAVAYELERRLAPAGAMADHGEARPVRAFGTDHLRSTPGRERRAGVRRSPEGSPEAARTLRTCSGTQPSSARGYTVRVGSDVVRIGTRRARADGR